MRLWSLHPQYLDRQALVACWRESLLAQAVLAGRTRGYRHHPQLRRFAAQPEPAAAIAGYLQWLADEADRRGYRFDRGRIDAADGPVQPIPVTEGQLDLERRHLLAKVERRSPQLAPRLAQLSSVQPHPSFRAVPGPVEEWELSERG